MSYVLCMWLYMCECVCVYLSMHVHMFSEAHVYGSAHADVCGSQRWIFGGVLQEPVTLIFGVGSLTKIWGILIRLGWLASEPLRAYYLLPSAWIITMHHYLTCFWVLGIKLSPSCLCGKQFTDSSCPRYVLFSFIFIFGFHRLIYLLVYCLCVRACVCTCE